MTEMCTFDDISDEEISTCKERHSRLGEDNLNDTLEYDFGGQPRMEERFEELKAEENGLVANRDTSHVAETKFEGLMLLTRSVPLVSIPTIQPCDLVHDCSCSNVTSCDLNKDAANIPAKNDSVADLKDNL